MNSSKARPSIGSLLIFALAFTLGAYFTFAAVQGDYGVFRQVQIRAEADVLRAERDQLKLALAEMQNRTHRLSDDYLDIDLLDEQARDVLGYIRADEVVIR
ncbi:MAG: septum formation initiator family protein [Paracoccaceae bacterium]|nr:septum formation initiator family protein [Paracoccaceae bacterium]